MDSKITLTDYREAFISNRKKAKQELSQGINSTFMILISLISGLFVYYIWTLNSNATIGYNIRDLERDKSQLLLEKEFMKTKLGQLETISTIKNDSSLFDQMEKVAESNYLVIETDKQYVYQN